jgi:hypothetical protein
MRKLVVLCALVFFGCAGDAPPKQDPKFIDSNGDGKPDGVDADGDGKPDFKIPSCTSCQAGGGSVCDDPLVDVDGDGIPDGLDLDCDGTIDIPFDDGDGTGGSSTCIVVVNNESISCTSTDGGPSTCECKVDNQVVKTCTTTSDSACSIPGDNCCGF